MNTWDADALIKGQTLRLKGSRMAAYGLDNPSLVFLGVKERKGYKRGFIIAQDSIGKVGYYELSDFAYHAPRQPEPEAFPINKDVSSDFYG